MKYLVFFIVMFLGFNVNSANYIVGFDIIGDPVDNLNGSFTIDYQIYLENTGVTNLRVDN